MVFISIFTLSACNQKMETSSDELDDKVTSYQIDNDNSQNLQSKQDESKTTEINIDKSLPSYIYGKKVALLIGNNDYENVTPLKNAINDVLLLEDTLINLGFDVTVIKNVSDRREVLRLINSFSEKAKQAESSIFYFSGQGMQDNNDVGYIFPTNVDLKNEDDISFYGVNINEVIKKLSHSKALVSLIMFDVCRNNPYVSLHKGISLKDNSSLEKGDKLHVDVEPQVLVSYSTQKGELAMDGDGNNSPYASAVNHALEQSKEKPLLTLFDNVRVEVQKESNGRQKPSREGDIRVNTYLLYQQKSR